MITLSLLLCICGAVHFGIFVAATLVPIVLDWRNELTKLDPLLRQLVWTYGAFIAMTIVGFGIVSILFAEDLASGAWLARAVCGFIAVFWTVRLVLQFFVFDPKPYLTNWFLVTGSYCLTIAFILNSIVYWLAAICPHVAFFC